MDLPIDDLVKVGTGGAGGLGFIALIARFLKGDMKRMEIAQAKINTDLYSKLGELTSLVARNELEAARTYVRQEDFAALRAHIDAQFVDQRNFFLELMRRQK